MTTRSPLPTPSPARAPAIRGYLVAQLTIAGRLRRRHHGRVPDQGGTVAEPALNVAVQRIDARVPLTVWIPPVERRVTGVERHRRRDRPVDQLCCLEPEPLRVCQAARVCLLVPSYHRHLSAALLINRRCLSRVPDSS